jgi:hypothetical protein
MKNRKQNYAILIGLFIFLLLNTGISIFIYQQNNDTKASVQTDSRFIKLQSIMQKQFETANRYFVGNNAVVDSLKNYIENNIVLMLHLDKYSCISCIDNAIADLLSFKDSIDSQNVLIIFSTESVRDAILLKNKIQNKFKILCIRDGDINLEGISENLPIYFCLIDNQLKPFNIYFYATEFAGLNKKYLSIVYQRFFKKEVIEKVLDTNLTTVETEQTEIEFQDLKVGTTSEAIFVLKNTGTKPLVIQMVDASCGCTVPEWEKQPIGAGKSTEIKVKITPEKSEYFNKTVTVHCNTEKGQVMFSIRGTVDE